MSLVCSALSGWMDSPAANTFIAGDAFDAFNAYNVRDAFDVRNAFYALNCLGQAPCPWSVQPSGAGWTHRLLRRRGYILGFISSERTPDVPLGQTFGATPTPHTTPPSPFFEGTQCRWGPDLLGTQCPGTQCLLWLGDSMSRNSMS